MKVWELIAKLGKMPANAEVLFSTRAHPDDDYESVNPSFDEESLDEEEPFVNIYIVAAHVEST